MIKIVINIKAVLSNIAFSNKDIGEKYVINPYDLYALQKLIELKKVCPVIITCLTMGSKEAELVLYRCLALGADKAVLLNDESFAGSDTYATSYILAKAYEKLEYDVVVCGNESIDGETGQVPYSLAQRLQMVCISKAQQIHLVKDGNIYLEYKKNSKLYSATIKLPAFVCFSELSTEYADVSLISLKRAQKENITVWDKTDLCCDERFCGKDASKTFVKKSEPIYSQKTNHIVVDSETDKAAFIMEQIKKVN